LRDELLDGEVFYTLREAEIVIESWRRHSTPFRSLRSLAKVSTNAGEPQVGRRRDRAPAPEVFVPGLTAWPVAQSRPAPPAKLPLAPRPTLN